MLSDLPVIPILIATDLAASRTFYEDVLGLPVHQADDTAVTYAWGGQPRLRLTVATEGTKDTGTRLVWIVPQLRAQVDQLQARGARFEERDTGDVRTANGIADRGEAWVAWLTDPAGNVIGIEEMKGHPTW